MQRSGWIRETQKPGRGLLRPGAIFLIELWVPLAWSQCFVKPLFVSFFKVDAENAGRHLHRLKRAQWRHVEPLAQKPLTLQYIVGRSLYLGCNVIVFAVAAMKKPQPYPMGAL